MFGVLTTANLLLPHPLYEREDQVIYVTYLQKSLKNLVAELKSNLDLLILP